jgi:hypothetical protein
MLLHLAFRGTKIVLFDHLKLSQVGVPTGDTQETRHLRHVLGKGLHVEMMLRLLEM